MTPQLVVPLDGRHAADGPQRLEVVHGRLVVVLRALVTPMAVSLDDVAVVARRRTPADPALCRTPVLPAAQLQGATARPNLLVVFRRPLRVPAIKMQSGGTLSLSRKRSTSEDGLFIDGMWFALDDPDTALEQMAAQGLPVSHDAAPTLATVVGTSAEAPPEADVRRRSGRLVSALLTASLLGFVAMVGGTAFTDDHRWIGQALFLVGFPVFAVGLCAALWLTFRRPWAGVRPDDRRAGDPPAPPSHLR